MRARSRRRPGDVIVGAAGRSVTSAAAFARVLADAEPGGELPLDVRAQDGTSRGTGVSIALVPDIRPLADSDLLYNKILVALQAGVERADDSLTRSASLLNLAIAHMRLGSWDLAIRVLDTVALPAGPGVSAATVAYLTGLCLKEIGQVPEARESFNRALAVGEGTLSVSGPPVGPLAQQQLDSMPEQSRGESPTSRGVRGAAPSGPGTHVRAPRQRHGVRGAAPSKY